MAGQLDRAEILANFITEIQGYLSEIEVHIDRLQRFPGDQTSMEDIYRRAHTIAGSAAMMDLPAIQQLGASIESLAGDALDGMISFQDMHYALIRRILDRLNQAVTMIMNGTDPVHLVTQNTTDFEQIRGATPGSSPLPQALGGWGSDHYIATAQPPSQPMTPQYPPSAHDYLPTAPLREPLANYGIQPPLSQTSQDLTQLEPWRVLLEQEKMLEQQVDTLVQSISMLRDVNNRFELQRNEMLSFVDGSQESLERLEQWAGKSMGIDLRNSPEHVRRLLPISVIWVITARLKQNQDSLTEAIHAIATLHENTRNKILHIQEITDSLGSALSSTIGAVSPNPQGGYTATIAQFSWDPSNRSYSAANLQSTEHSNIERQVREELRRELEGSVRAEIAAQIHREEEDRLRRELMIEIRKEYLGGMDVPRTISNINIAQSSQAPRKIEIIERSPEAIEIFCNEAEEHLQVISDGIEQLAKSPYDVESIRQIRRAAHTLKGAAAITGFATVAELAHICEDLLDRIADHTIEVTQNVVSLLLDTSQALSAMIQDDTVEHGGEPGLLAALHPRYDAILGQESTNGIQQSMPAVQLSQMQPHIREKDLQQSETADTMGISQPHNPERDLYVRIPLRTLDELTTLFRELVSHRTILDDHIDSAIKLTDDSKEVGEKIRETIHDIEKSYEERRRTQHQPINFTRNAPQMNQGSVFGQSGRQLFNAPYANSPQLPPGTGNDELGLERYDELYPLVKDLNEGVTDIMAYLQELSNQVQHANVELRRESQLSIRFQDALMKTRLLPFSALQTRLYQAIHAIAIKYGKEFELYVEGGETEIDRRIFEEISAPLLHLVRNAIYHGIELPQEREIAGKARAGRIMLSALTEGNELVVTVSDDGRGINTEQIKAIAIARGMIDGFALPDDDEILNMIFQPGFSTSETVTEEGGRGVGLDVVHDMVTRSNGTISLLSVPGLWEGSTFTMRIPISLQVQTILTFVADKQQFAIPLNVITHLKKYADCTFFQRGNGIFIEEQGLDYPLVHIGSYVQTTPQPINQMSYILLININNQRLALLVDTVLDSRENVVQNIGPHLVRVPYILGATVLRNEKVVLILDIANMLRSPPKRFVMPPYLPSAREVSEMQGISYSERGKLSNTITAKTPSISTIGRNTVQTYILVVDDSPSVRRAVSSTLNDAGWTVHVARDGAEALNVVAQKIPACILLDIEMPRMDGYEFMATLRKQPGYENIPIIILTSRAANKHQLKAMQLGASDYLIKPYQDDELLNKVKTFVNNR